MIHRNGLCAFAVVAGWFALGCGAGGLDDGTGEQGEVADVAAPGIDEQGGLPPLPNCTPPQTIVCLPNGSPCHCTPITNLALNKPSYQSSTLFDAGPARANDGNTSGHWLNNSINHTSNGPGEWWYVDLGALKTITSVRISNRTDCCSERLSHYNVIAIVNNVWTVISNHQNDDTTGASQLNWPINNVKARYVGIQKTDANYLHLAEVQVMGL